MRFEALGIHQAFLVRIERHADMRGFFARTFCVHEFADAGLPTAAVQASTSFNTARGTVRGMHFQWPPSREGKLVRCLRGSVFDVLLDLRPDSPSYLRHISVSLDEENRDAVFIPHGIAHGFQTLTDNTELFYQMSALYRADAARGIRWDDPVLAIAWPECPRRLLSARDLALPEVASCNAA